MSREILFRGKRTDNREWAEGHYFKNENGTCIFTFPYYANYAGIDVMVKVDPETVCQYTGLTDKNGRKIFEGDIVGFEDCTSTDSGYWEQNCLGEVKWSEEEALFYVTNRLMAESYEVLQDCQVIGNIFDNPDLLEGGV